MVRLVLGDWPRGLHLEPRLTYLNFLESIQIYLTFSTETAGGAKRVAASYVESAIAKDPAMHALSIS